LTKKKNPFSLEFFQSYQGARLNFKKTENNPKLLILPIFFFNYPTWTFSPKQTSTITREVSIIWSCHPQFSFRHSLMRTKYLIVHLNLPHCFEIYVNFNGPLQQLQSLIKSPT
jgi:hypothetical protein